MIDLLIDKIIKKKNPTFVGLDTRLEYLPKNLIESCCGDKISIEGAAEAIFKFNRRIIDSVKEYVPGVKVQVAYYEMYGLPGIKAFKDTCQYAKDNGLIVIGDVKRNDIGSTAEAYAAAYLGETNLIEREERAYDLDFITVNPYLGIDGILPFLEACEEYNKGIFILVKTSNSSSADFQDIYVGDGEKMLYEVVAQKVSRWGEDLRGKRGYSPVGAVVGATHPKQAKELRESMPHTYFLVPGYGAQGGKAADIIGCFDEGGLGAVVNASRSIICAYRQPRWKDEFTEDQFDRAALAEVIAMRDDINNALKENGQIYW